MFVICFFVQLIVDLTKNWEMWTNIYFRETWWKQKQFGCGRPTGTNYSEKNKNNKKYRKIIKLLAVIKIFYLFLTT